SIVEANGILHALSQMGSTSESWVIENAILLWNDESQGDNRTLPPIRFLHCRFIGEGQPRIAVQFWTFQRLQFENCDFQNTTTFSKCAFGERFVFDAVKAHGSIQFLDCEFLSSPPTFR